MKEEREEVQRPSINSHVIIPRARPRLISCHVFACHAFQAITGCGLFFVAVLFKTAFIKIMDSFGTGVLCASEFQLTVSEQEDEVLNCCPWCVEKGKCCP